MKINLIDKLIAPSTRQFFKQGRSIPGYRFVDFLHGLIYARWTYLYIRLGIGESPLVKRFSPALAWLGAQLEKIIIPSETSTKQITFADTYHGKVVPLEAARQLVTINENIALPNLEKIIPYQLARDIILQNPDHITVLDCPCRSARPNPCLPLDVCLIVGEPFASLVIEHHPKRSRRITSQEAQDILRQEDERHHVHHAFFKDAMLGRFYAICNCCACCCGAMQAHKNGNPMLASSGYICRADDNLCMACGECTAICQFNALSLVEMTIHIDEAKCMGCGICVSQCSQEALSLVLAPEKDKPLEILQLIEEMSPAILPP